MALPLPATLSPSKVATFTECALAFRFSAIDRLPEPPSPWAAKGTLVHRVLERLFWEEPAGRRSVAAALAILPEAWEEVLADPENEGLDLDGELGATMLADAEELVRRYFRLEDPDRVRVVGTELRLEADLGGMRLRGIIDRLELDERGELVVTDYKTGKVPREHQERSRLGGVHLYALLCEQVIGRRPAKIQLLYLSEPVAIIATPTEQSIRGTANRTKAVWSAVERACATEDFRPKPSALCQFCGFQAWCPAFGGDPAEAPSRLRETPVETPVAAPASLVPA